MFIVKHLNIEKSQRVEMRINVGSNIPTLNALQAYSTLNILLSGRRVTRPKNKHEKYTLSPTIKVILHSATEELRLGKKSSC